MNLMRVIVFIGFLLVVGIASGAPGEMVQQAMAKAGSYYSDDYLQKIHDTIDRIGLGWFFVILFGPLLLGILGTLSEGLSIRRQNRSEKKPPIPPSKLVKIIDRSGRKYGMGSILLLQGIANRITGMPFMFELLVLGFFTGPISRRCFDMLRLIVKVMLAGEGAWAKRAAVLDDWLAVRHDPKKGHVLPVDEDGNEIDDLTMFTGPGGSCPYCRRPYTDNDDTIPNASP